MEREHPICDIHSHILPGIDDGCRTVEESVRVLRGCYEQGIHQVCLTPHYYPVEPASEFLARRDAAAQVLFERLKLVEQPVPEIVLGAEVAYRPGLCHQEDLDALCIGKSRYMLLEMPFGKWGDEVVRTVRSICSVRSIVPILAHIERYIPMQEKKILMQVLEQGVLVQMNAECLLHPFTRGKARRMLDSGMVKLLGSDCHNMTTRPPTITQAVEYLEDKGMDEVIAGLSRRSRAIFRDAVGR